MSGGAEFKLCKDCRWFRRSWVGVTYSTCHAPQRSTDTLVGGTSSGSGLFCSCEREDYETIPTCGSAARYFEPRPRRWWEFWRPNEQEGRVAGGEQVRSERQRASEL